MGESVGATIGAATLSLVNASEAVSNIKLTTEDHSISGKVSERKSGKPLKGVLMNLSGEITTATYTDDRGNYVFLHLNSGDYTITPTKEGYEFKPESRDVTITASDQNKVNFKGKKISKTSLSEKDILRNLASSLVTNEVYGWPYGDPDSEGYYLINGYKIRFYDVSDNIIADMETDYADAVKLEVDVEVPYENGGSVSGPLFANITISTDGPSFPLVFNGMLSLEMSSPSQYGTGAINGTVNIQNCTVDSEDATFFSSGSLDVTTSGYIATSEGFTVTHSESGTMYVTGSTFQGTLSLSYNVSGAPVPVGATVDMTVIVNADGHGSYSTNDPYVGSGTF